MQKVKTMDKIEKDEISGTDTTGHSWDGIKELDTPLPRWWLWTFYGTCIWALVYVILYPAIPLINDATKGVLGYSSRAAVAEDIAKARDAQSEKLSRIATMHLEEIRGDQELFRFAVAGGRSAFSVNCSQCHGSGATGSKGYANLNDDDWLWGGSLEEIYGTIAHGIRFTENEETRVSEMPAFGRDELLANDEIEDVVNYVVSLTGEAGDADSVERGATLFADNCAACHAEDASGDRTQGAPNLADPIWLYGGDRETILESVKGGRNGVMPAWAHRLDEATLRQLTLFVHSLGGGE